MGLKVGMVAGCLNTDHIRGMGKYAFELLQQSGEVAELEWVLFGDQPRHGMVVPSNKAVTTDVFEFRGDRFHFWEQIGVPLRSLKHNVDVLHCTQGTLCWWQPKPTVVTVHDTLSWIEREDTAVEAFFFDKLLPSALKRCAAIITISESSKVDILERWPWLDRKLSVIPHGIENAYFDEASSGLPNSLSEAIGPAPYLVYLGGPLARKRFHWALEVLARTQERDLHLVACGFGSEARGIAIAALPPALRGRVHFASFLSDAELRALYRGARGVLYPTLYEGFGFPAIEAQAAGVPVIFSALGSLKELVGPLALVVPPHDMQAWLGAVSDAMSMGESRATKSQAAAKWARSFSWSESFKRHLAVYRQAATTKN